MFVFGALFLTDRRSGHELGAGNLSAAFRRTGVDATLQSTPPFATALSEKKRAARATTERLFAVTAGSGPVPSLNIGEAGKATFDFQASDQAGFRHLTALSIVDEILPATKRRYYPCGSSGAARSVGGNRAGSRCRKDSVVTLSCHASASDLEPG